MSESSLIQKFQSARAKMKWWIIGSSLVAIITHFIIELTFVDYSYGTLKDKTPLAINLILRVSFLMSFVLGVFTLPKWYSFLALATVIFLVLSIGGR